MKAAPFEYSRPADIDEACALLAADDSARIIAGGQTLVPMMAMRLARPTRIVDINRIADLSYIRDEDDAVAIGATTRQCLVEHDALVAARLPLLARAIPWIGHDATRARGTIGGSLANADPAAELPLIAMTLDAVLSYRADGQTDDIPAAEFFIGPMITTLPAGAVLTGVRFPIWSGKTGVGFHEVNARRSDFAFVSAAAQVELGDDGVCKRLALCVGAATDSRCGSRPLSSNCRAGRSKTMRSRSRSRKRLPISTRSKTCMPRQLTAPALPSNLPSAP